MKNIFFLILLCLCGTAFSQCVNKCPHETAVAHAVNVATGADFVVPTYTITWASTLPFTGQGTAVINISDVGATAGSYNISYTVSDGTCDTTVTRCITVITPAPPTAEDPIVCTSGACRQLSGVVVSPVGGVWKDASGTTITQVCPGDIGDALTYEVTSGGCSGTVAAVVVGRPGPNGAIQLN